MGKKLEQKLHQKRIYKWMANKHNEICSISLVTKKMQIEVKKRYQYTSTRMANFLLK